MCEECCEQEVVSCPACGGWGEIMGSLGNLNYYRCRCCGVVFQAGNPEQEEE